jgi:hypothetical protein
MYDGVKIGQVEIRHSAYCATVWSRVKNLTGGTAQVREAIVLFSDSNGAGRVEHWYPTIDTIPNNGFGWSNQYRDRASFSARGGIFFDGGWRYAETARTVAWAQYAANFGNNPYACNHTTFACERWPTLANGNSVTRYYWTDPVLQSMAKTGGGSIDITGDVDFMFDKFNDVPASNPFLLPDALGVTPVVIVAYECMAPGTRAVGGGEDGIGNDHLYDEGEILFNSCMTWTQTTARETMCHETDHMMGLWHVISTVGIDNVGSKATCIGHWMPTGPGIDDVSALQAVYSGVVP